MAGDSGLPIEPPPAGPEWWDAAEAATCLGISREAVRVLYHLPKGDPQQLPGYRFGRSLRFRPGEVERYVGRQRNGGPAGREPVAGGLGCIKPAYAAAIKRAAAGDAKTLAEWVNDTVLAELKRAGHWPPKPGSGRAELAPEG